MLRNLADKFYKVVGLVPQTVTATGSSAVVDLKGLRNFAFMIATGAMAFDGSNKLTFKIEESNDNSTFNDVAAAEYYPDDNLVYDAAGDASNVQLIQYRGNKRYVKLTWTETGTVSVPMSVVGLATDLEHMPR
jgi:hypothetical protein